METPIDALGLARLNMCWLMTRPRDLSQKHAPSVAWATRRLEEFTRTSNVSVLDFSIPWK